MPVESVPEPLRRAHLYLAALDDEATQKARREDHRAYLKEWLINTFEPNDKGDYVYEFPKPIGATKGLMLQRRVSEWVDEDRARALVSRHGLEDRCLTTVTSSVFDFDELYACNQEGIISDEEIDTILELSESYALVKVKG